MSKFSSMSMAELREIVKAKGLRGTSTMKKQELIEMLSKLEESEAKEPKIAPKEKAERSPEKSVIVKKEKKAVPKEKQKTEQKETPKTETAKVHKEVPKTETAEVHKEVPKTETAEVHRETQKAEVAEVSKEAESKEVSKQELKAGSEAPAEEIKTVQGQPSPMKTERVSERRVEYGRKTAGQKPAEQIRRPVQQQRFSGDTERKPYNNQNKQMNNADRQENAPGSMVSSENNNSRNDAQTHTQRPDYSEYARLVQQPGVPMPADIEQMDSKDTKEGILEIMPDGYGFIRCDNFLPGEHDVYVSPIQIRKMNLKTGDIIVGNTRIRNQSEKFSALLYIKSINGFNPMEATKRPRFEDLTPIFPNKRIRLETPGCPPAMRIVDLISPIGKGQRGMIVSQPKAGKTTLLKEIAKAITRNHPDMHMMILLIDERPEEVTDIKESIEGKNVEVIYSTFDELPENHKRVSEMVIERAKRLVEHKKDVVILLDSITRLARAYNLTVQASGRTLSGGLDPAALYMPKKFFGAARCMRESGSLTILATALVETGSRMDDVVFEEFKGTGNMELVLDRSLSEKRIFPAIDLPKSSTRRDDLLLDAGETEANLLMRKAFNSMRTDDAVERIIQMFVQTRTNRDFIELIKKTKIGH